MTKKYQEMNATEIIEQLFSMLQNEIADRLDVNRHHIRILSIGDIIGECCGIGEECPEEWVTEREVRWCTQEFNAEKKEWQYGPEKTARWAAIEYKDGDYEDHVDLEAE